MILDLIGIYRARHDPEKRLTLVSKFASDRTIEQFWLPIFLFKLFGGLIALAALAVLIVILLLASKTTEFVALLGILPSAVIFIVIKLWQSVDRGKQIVEDSYVAASKKGAAAYRARRGGSKPVITEPVENIGPGDLDEDENTPT